MATPEQRQQKTRLRQMGASPDGLICCAGKVCGCIEVKCPYFERDACLKSQFYCNKDENNVVTLNEGRLICGANQS